MLWTEKKFYLDVTVYSIHIEKFKVTMTYNARNLKAEIRKARD